MEADVPKRITGSTPEQKGSTQPLLVGAVFHFSAYSGRLDGADDLRRELREKKKARAARAGQKGFMNALWPAPFSVC
jgi:hypothetical protein